MPACPKHRLIKVLSVRFPAKVLLYNAETKNNIVRGPCRSGTACVNRYCVGPASDTLAFVLLEQVRAMTSQPHKQASVHLTQRGFPPWWENASGESFFIWAHTHQDTHERKWALTHWQKHIQAWNTPHTHKRNETWPTLS